MSILPRQGSTALESELVRRVEKLAKINAALMQRVERSMDQQANGYSLFQTAIGLETQVSARTGELKLALNHLERNNDELIAARDKAEQADRLKTRFFTAVSHDLLQPLHAARLTLSALSGSTNPGETAAMALQVEHALSSVEEMLRTILDMSKLETGMMSPSQQPIGARDLFASLLLDMRALANARGLMLTSRVADVAVLSDPLMLRRILQNLLANAVRYTEHGGVKLTGRRRGNGIRIEVWDTGPGIPPEEQARIFEEFQRGSASERPGAARSGFGLGLAIVQRMASALGHSIELCSRVGQGSRFSITVPYAGPASAVDIKPHASQTAPSYGLAAAKVFVIDNDYAVLDAMRVLLERWDCETRFATRIEDLEAVIGESGFRPDIVIADYHLDRGETGLEAIEILRKTVRPDLPAIVVTADHTKEVADAVLGASCDILCKPVKPAELRSLMLHLLQ